MEAKKLLSEVPCQEHPTYPIQGVNLQNPNEPKLYCFLCVLEQKDISVLSNLKAIPDLIKTITEASIRNKNSIQQQEKPKECVNLLSLKDERIEKLCKHIETEKLKVSNFFDSLIKEVAEILLEKKKKHLEELDLQIGRMSSNFDFFEKALKKLYPSDEELANLLPSQESLEERFQNITNSNKLMDFVKDLGSSLVQQERDFDLSKKLEEERTLLTQLSKELLKDHAPVYNPENWKVSEFTKEIQERVANYFDPVTHLQSPISILEYQEKYFENIDSTIVTKDEFSVISSWLPENVKSNPTLLYRSSKHGKDPKVFHQLCDGKRNTVTILKALFEGANKPCVIGGFLDEPWQNENVWIKSNNAFLFSLTSKIKCPVLEPSKAAYGYATLGPLFGYGNCLKVSLDDDSYVYYSQTYKDVSKLVNKQNPSADYTHFTEIEVEVFSLN